VEANKQFNFQGTSAGRHLPPEGAANVCSKKSCPNGVLLRWFSSKWQFLKRSKYCSSCTTWLSAKYVTTLSQHSSCYVEQRLLEKCFKEKAGAQFVRTRFKEPEARCCYQRRILIDCSMPEAVFNGNQCDQIGHIFAIWAIFLVLGPFLLVKTPKIHINKGNIMTDICQNNQIMFIQDSLAKSFIK
jgi:hypothetical protein